MHATCKLPLLAPHTATLCHRSTWLCTMHRSVGVADLRLLYIPWTNIRCIHTSRKTPIVIAHRWHEQRQSHEGTTDIYFACAPCLLTFLIAGAALQ